MLCKLHSVYKIIHCIHCVILHRGSQIIIHYTIKGQFFKFNLEKNYTRQKIFTQTPSVVSVTNMRSAILVIIVVKTCSSGLKIIIITITIVILIVVDLLFYPNAFVTISIAQAGGR